MGTEWNRAIKQTPLINEYFLKKQEYPGHLILMQVGKFYETYGDDACILRDKLGLKVAKKGNLKMAGVPVETFETYGRLLIEQGEKIVCINQDRYKTLDDNNLVIRRIHGIYTPGLNPFSNKEKSNYLMAIKFDSSVVNLAFIDIIVGELYTETLMKSQLTSFITKIQPAETLVCESDRQSYKNLMDSFDKTTIVSREAFQPSCLNLIETSLNIQKIRKDQRSVVGSIIWYCFQNQFLTLSHIRYCGLFNCSKFLKLETFSITNLELLETLRPLGRTLFQVLDKTKTAMGRRELKQRLLFPSCEKEVIEDRLNWVEFFKDQRALSEQLQEFLDGVGDLARLINKSGWASSDPRYVLSLAESLAQVNQIRELFISSDSADAKALGNEISVCTEFRENVFNTLEPQSPFETGRWIRVGVCKQLDQLKETGVVEKREQLMIELTKELGFRPKLLETKNGWVCEFTHYQSKKLGLTWQIQSSSKRKVKCSHPLLQSFDEWYQTTGRSITEKIERLEFHEYLKLVEHALRIREEVQRTAVKLADIDIAVALAKTAQEYNYTRPEITTELTCLIHEGRHPVLEQQVDYISNNCVLDSETNEQIMLITGANMGGKSAFVRQIAIISIMAQMGSFVPAQKARLGIRDSIFVRVGGFDNLSLNQSTFMVEMTEIAYILNNLTPRSLVVLDEIGRGTSFVDGFALACSILEYLHEHPWAPHVLCTTHFCELAEFSHGLIRCRNFTMQSHIHSNQLHHSYRLVQGVCKNSLGVETAQSASIPNSVVERARLLRDQMDHTTRFKFLTKTDEEKTF